MECECGVERVGCLTALAHAQVVPKEFLVVGIYAILDDCFGTLYGVFSAQVGYALIGDEHIDRVLAVVEVRNHGDDCRDKTALGN